MLWGDSRTEGIGDVAPSIFPTFVANALPALHVIGAGRSGQTAAQIVARQGGEPTRLTLEGNMIPTSGPVDTDELTRIGYVPSAAERADIAAGVFPGGMFADVLHLRRIGQMIWANRVTDQIRARGWT